MDIKLIAQGRVPGGASLTAALKECLIATPVNRLDVAVAYATVSGIIALEQSVGEFPPVSRWVVGLDDAITQPAAIERLIALPGAEVRLAGLADQGRRFHPKLYCLWSANSPEHCILSVGSGNMTLNGLRKNGEAAVILSASSAKESDELKAIWSEMWALGAPPTPASLAAYEERFKAAKNARKTITETGAAPPEPGTDEAVVDDIPLDGDPTTATFAWLDIGSATAQGREVELPRAIMPYFGVGPHTPSPIQLHLRQKINGQVDVLPLTMRQDNMMWRIGFTQAAIHAGSGRNTFRPVAGGNRSDLTAFFSRTGHQQYDVEFVQLGTPSYQALVAKSTAVGAHHRTQKTPSGRSFGFF